MEHVALQSFAEMTVRVPQEAAKLRATNVFAEVTVTYSLQEQGVCVCAQSVHKDFKPRSHARCRSSGGLASSSLGSWDNRSCFFGFSDACPRTLSIRFCRWILESHNTKQI